MFKTGDAVVHPDKGAGVVLGIKKMPLPRKREYYQIRMADQRAKTVLMVPIKRVEELGLRPAISRAAMEQVWQTLAAPPEELPAKHKLRYTILKDKLLTGDILAVAEAVRDMEWRKAKEQRLNAPGQRIYNKAIRMLAGEISVVFNIDMQQAEQKALSYLNLPVIDEEA